MILEPICEGRKCLVVGSAPGLQLPNMSSYEVVIGANGGAGFTPHDPQILVTTSHLYRGQVTNQELSTQRRIASVNHFESIWVDGVDSYVKVGLKSWSVGYERLRGTGESARLEMIQRATRLEHPGRVSTGIWAISIAVISSAFQVDYCGIEPSRNGHEDMSWDHAPRDHSEPDKIALDALQAKGVRRVG